MQLYDDTGYLQPGEIADTQGTAGLVDVFAEPPEIAGVTEMHVTAWAICATAQ